MKYFVFLLFLSVLTASSSSKTSKKDLSTLNTLLNTWNNKISKIIEAEGADVFESIIPLVIEKLGQVQDGPTLKKVYSVALKSFVILHSISYFVESKSRCLKLQANIISLAPILFKGKNFTEEKAFEFYDKAADILILHGLLNSISNNGKTLLPS